MAANQPQDSREEDAPTTSTLNTVKENKAELIKSSLVMTQQFQKATVPEQPTKKLKKQQQPNGKGKRGKKRKAAESDVVTTGQYDEEMPGNCGEDANEQTTSFGTTYFLLHSCDIFN